ncbi:DUF6274 family protein [Streptomyces sp. NPDC091376]|uniref:DUF6274 family protein n=1 Tax=Streptomyces sp. NPDC091376 TaxID=3365994 RepID=UPI00380215FE
MAASTARHETRALLRAHLAAVSGYRHLTRHCPVCHRLLRLAMDPSETVPMDPYESAPEGPEPLPEPRPAEWRAERGTEPGAVPAERGPMPGPEPGTGPEDEGPSHA